MFFREMNFLKILARRAKFVNVSIRKTHYSRSLLQSSFYFSVCSVNLKNTENVCVIDYACEDITHQGRI